MESSDEDTYLLAVTAFTNLSKASGNIPFIFRNTDFGFTQEQKDSLLLLIDTSISSLTVARDYFQ